MTKLEKLTELFRSLGANEPEKWASSQISEGINQLGRFLFLRQAWRLVISEEDRDWIDAAVSYSEKAPTAPGSGTGASLKRLLHTGCSKADITNVVRGMQYELLFGLCYLLDDPGEVEDSVANLGWALVQTDEDGNIVDTIQGLHESLLEMDPTGREMRPFSDEMESV